MTGQHIHFVGIGGAGLSALAYVMLGRGDIVSGSDASAPNAITTDLARRGATIFAGHAAENIAGADLVVVTSAARPDNPEITAAQARGIPTVKRREFLRQVTKGYDVIAVAGSHGKTTTTAMIATMLRLGGLDPTVVVGGIIPGWQTNARVGTTKWFVIEADEYDYAFLGLEPKIAVLTNVDHDHPDLFPTPGEYQKAFAEFLVQTRGEGVIVVCGDHPTARALVGASNHSFISYGLDPSNGWRAVDIQPNRVGGSDFQVWRENLALGTASLQIPGMHNVLNALAALVVGSQVKIDFEVARRALQDFGGVARRFQVRGTFRGATIVDDYAHHPTEIRATLQAARMRYPHARIVVLFQPHTFSRTRALWDEFADAFGSADRVLITEIYAAREHDGEGLSSNALVERIHRGNVRFVGTLSEAETLLREELGPGDVLIVMGAGNVVKVSDRLVENGDA